MTPTFLFRRRFARTGRRGSPGRPARGVTLVELMFTIALLAILATMAVPLYRDASLNSRLSAIANDLYASVQLARSMAIKRNAATTLCRSADGSTCASSGDWDQGWVVLDEADRVIKSHAAVPDGYRLVQTSGATTLTFQPIGVGATSAAFTACREEPFGNQERVVTVTATGMAYVTHGDTDECPPE